MFTKVAIVAALAGTVNAALSINTPVSRLPLSIMLPQLTAYYLGFYH